MEQRAAYGPWPQERPRLVMIKDGGESYSALPHGIMRDASLSRDARLLYAVMQAYWWQSGECFASNATLAADMGCSDSQLRRYIGELIEAGKVTARRAGRGQAKAYAPAEMIANKDGQPFISERFNRSSVSGSESNRSPVAPQPFTGDNPNRSPVTVPYKKTPEKTLEEELPPTVVDGDATAPPATAMTDQAKILRSLSDGAREILDWHRQCHGRRQPAKLNPESARVLEEAVADLGVDRLKESVRYMAGKIPAVPELSKALRAARTKRSQDEAAPAEKPPYRNGTDRMLPGAASKQQSKWSDFKGRNGGNVVKAAPDGQ